MIFLAIALNGQGQCLGSEDFVADLTNGCLPSSIKFSASGFGSGASFSWDFGSGFSASNVADSIKFHLFNNVGNYNVRLRIDYPSGFCLKTRNNYISITNGPKVKLYIDFPVLCDFADSITLIDSTANVVSRDFIIDGKLYQNAGSRLRHQFTSPGSKQIAVKFQTSSGCFASWSNDSAVVAYKPPLLSFNSQSNLGCAPVKALFIPFVITYNGMVISDYNWSFPGGTPALSNQVQPQVLYTNTGKYDATLNVKATNGCSYKINKKAMVEVYYLPLLKMTTVDTILCNKSDVHLINTTTGVFPGFYSWVIPAGANITESSTDSDSVTVNLPAISGKYDFGLQYQIYNCYIDTMRKKMVQLNQTKAILNAPEQNFCRIPATVFFNDSGTRTDSGCTYNVKWRIRDSLGVLVDSSLAKTDSFVFTKFGQYSLEFYARSSSGCHDSIINAPFFSIGSPKPAIGYSKKNPCPGEWVTFNDQTPAFAPKIYPPFRNWILYDRDFTTILKADTNKQFKYSFVDTGTYKLRLVVWNAIGCKDSLTDSVTLRVVSPVLNFGIDKPNMCRNETFRLDGSLIPSTPGIIYNWEIVNTDDSAYKYFEQNANPLFKTVGGAGRYSVRCTAFNAQCTTSVLKNNLFFVSGTLYKGTFDSLIGCSPFTAQLKAEKIYNIQKNGNDSGLRFQWFSTPGGALFTDSLAMMTRVIFNKSGCYQVGMLAVNGDGCQSNWLNIINTCVGNNASFMAPKSVCFGDSIRLINNSSPFAKRYRWKVYSPQGGVISIPTDTAFQVSFLPAASGDYQVMLYATTNTGCIDSFEKTITVVQPKASIYTADSMGNCGPFLARFRYNGTPGVSFIWYWGDQSQPLFNATGSASHLYDIQNGQNRFHVSIRMFDAYGCSDSITLKNAVNINGPVPFFVPLVQSGCEPLAVSFLNKSSNIYKSAFYDDLGRVDSLKKDTFMVGYSLKMPTDSISKYFPYLVVSDSLGLCVKAYKLNESINVFRKPLARFTFSDSLICLNKAVRFSSFSQGANKLKWDFNGDGVWDDTISNMNYRFTKKGYFYPLLLATNQGGCIDTARALAPIEVFPAVKGGIYVSSKSICRGDSLYLYQNTDTLYQGKLQFRWKFKWAGRVVDSANVPNPVKLFMDTGNYDVSLIIINSAGCADTINSIGAFRINNKIPYVGTAIHYVTLENNKDIFLTWRRNFSPGFKSYVVYKIDLLGRKQIYTTFDVNDTSFLDTLVNNPSQNASAYEVHTVEECHDLPISGMQHAQMVAKAFPFNLNAVRVSWNAYTAWKGDVSYQVYKSTDGISFQKVHNTNMTSWIDNRVCDSLYYYRIVGIHLKDDSYMSVSNITNARPTYIPDTRPTDVKSVSVINEPEIEVRWDTGFAINRTRSYTLISSRFPYDQWKPEWSGLADRVRLNVLEMHPESRFAVVREDVCGFYGDTGLYGTNVYLEAFSSGDTALLNWTPYEKTRKGVSQYAIQWLDPGSGKFLLVSQFNGKQLAAKDSVPKDFYSEKFCYRVAAVSNDFPEDTSFSNIGCVAFGAAVYIPNTFTPNGDPWNECYRPVISFVYGDVAIENLKYTFEIYGRWGEKLFETHDPQGCWDGTVNGKPAATGTYIYRYYAVGFKEKEKLSGSGPFLLLR